MSRARLSAALVATLLIAAAAAGGLSARSAPAPKPAPAPTLIVPARPESVSIESEPAPLLGPGHPAPPDATKRSPREYAREQFALGRTLEQTDNLLGALLAYTNAVRSDSTLREVCLRLGLLQRRLGKHDEAERMFREELRRDPKNAEAERELAVTLSRRGKHDEAIRRLRGLTTREPDHDDHWFALGYAYANAVRLREAESALRRAIALPPDRAAEHRDLGVVLGKLGRTREARAEYRRSLDLDPHDPTTWLDVGNLEARAHRPDSALAAYRQAERVDSTYALAYEGQIKVLVSLDRRDEVADVYLRWVTALPDDDEVRLRAVRHLAALGRRDRALEIGRDGVRHQERSAAAHLILGLALESYGGSRESLTEFRTAQSLFRTPRDRGRVQALIDSMRVAAPDSLRAMFAADSAAHARPD